MHRVSEIQNWITFTVVHHHLSRGVGIFNRKIKPCLLYENIFGAYECDTFLMRCECKRCFDFPWHWHEKLRSCCLWHLSLPSAVAFGFAISFPLKLGESSQQWNLIQRKSRFEIICFLFVCFHVCFEKISGAKAFIRAGRKLFKRNLFHNFFCEKIFNLARKGRNQFIWLLKYGKDEETKIAILYLFQLL